MTDVLEFSDVTSEINGAMCPGRLKLTDQNIVFKNTRTGKVEQIQGGDIDLANWQKMVGTWGVRLFLKSGALHRFSGFKDSEQDKIGKFFKKHYAQEMLEKELSVKGWNWGTAKFTGSVLSFDVGHLTAFDIPLNNVSQCTTGKNEVTLEFHPNDEAPVNLMEMRFHIPTSELAGDDPVEAFHEQVMKEASIISVSGDAIAIFREIQCLTPRGRYDIKVFESFFQLHGKTFDYKIPMSTVIRLFSLPHKDGRHNFFVMSLDPPIKQGQTRYHYLVFLFGQDERTTVELPFTEEQLAEKYEGRLTKEISGPMHEVIGTVMKAIVSRKISTPGAFKGHSGTPAISCSYKAASGFFYPLERGFIFIHKPPLHIRFEEITNVNFARGGGSTRSFDFEVELKSGVVHTFSSIEKEEYSKLYSFITSKKLRIKNTGKPGKQRYGSGDDFGDSDKEDEPDAYLARVKREAKERDEDGEAGDSEEEESTDEDFNPNVEESDIAEEYDSNAPDSDDSGSDASAASGGGGGGSDAEPKKKKAKKEKKDKPKKAKTVSEKPRKRRQKKERDENKPKRAATAYMLWFNEQREKIKADNPGIAFTDIAKKGGELWKKLSDKSPWEAKAAKSKEVYMAAMADYKAMGMGGDKKKPAARKSTGGGAKSSSSPTKAGSGSAFKSKEYIEDSDSSSSAGSGDKKKAAAKKPQKPEIKKEIKTEISDSDNNDSDDKKKNSESENDDSGKEQKKSDTKVSEKKDSEKVKTEKKESVIEEDDDEFPEEPEDESTPPTSEHSEAESD